MREKSLNDHFLRLGIQRTHYIVEQGYIVATVHRTSQGLQALALVRVTHVMELIHTTLCF